MGAADTETRRCTQVERLALFLGALHRDEAEALLLGLARDLRPRALAFHREALGWDSARRQARLALEFGPQDRQLERARRLVREAPGRLAEAIVAVLPAALQGHFPPPGPAEGTAPALRLLAVRLVREALQSAGE
jgi:hypothetical protein